MVACQDLKYSKEHAWIKIEGNRARLGITDYAQESLGDVVFTELPIIGQTVTQGQSIGIVESVKSVSDIYAPLSGQVVEVNEELGETPELINQDPYGQGWLVVIELVDAAQMGMFLDAGQYEKLLVELEAEEEG
ncbi:MAG: glycine cleavage system protein GcvH [Thermincolia bacterium]